VGSVLKYRQGALGFDNVLVSDVIWKNINKGERANTEELKEAFGTDNEKEIAHTIADKGDLQLTDAERKEILEKKRNEIVNYIHKYYTDPRTRMPHPVARIEAAFEELKVRIDPDTPNERQIQDILKRLPEALPIRKTEISGTITIGHQYTAQIQTILKKHPDVQIKGEKYTDEGSQYEVTMVPGGYDRLVKDLHDITQGSFDFNVEGIPTSDTEKAEKHNAGRGGGRGGGRGRGKRN